MTVNQAFNIHGGKIDSTVVDNNSNCGVIVNNLNVYGGELIAKGSGPSLHGISASNINVYGGEIKVSTADGDGIRTFNINI